MVGHDGVLGDVGEGRRGKQKYIIELNSRSVFRVLDSINFDDKRSSILTI